MITIDYQIGDVVTLKSHPLAFEEDGQIHMYINQIPPFMCVKEIQIEKKKQIYSNETKEKQITGNVKYLCVYFNQHRMIFEEKFVYQEMLIGLKGVKFHRKNSDKPMDYMMLVDEVLDYKPVEYEFGKRVFFKTYKLEKRKKSNKAGHDTKSSTRTYLTHTSPAFLLSGYKLNEKSSVYNQKNGELQHEYSKELIKILWYNSYQEKMSEAYFPIDFFTEDERIYQKINAPN